MNYFITKKLLFFNNFCHIKISYYWFNKEKLLQKAKDKYQNCRGKEKAGEYYLKNKDVIKEKSNNKNKFFRRKKRSKKRMWKK